MKKLLSKFFSRPVFLIRYSKEMQNFVVIHRDLGIVYAGPQAQCNLYLKQNAA